MKETLVSTKKQKKQNKWQAGEGLTKKNKKCGDEDVCLIATAVVDVNAAIVAAASPLWASLSLLLPLHGGGGTAGGGMSSPIMVVSTRGWG